jgi:phosphatidylglycerol---prolipoprotein diacylglyceryl transferase
LFPVLFQNDGLIIYTHDFFTGLGLLVGFLIYYYELYRRRMLSDKIFWISIMALIGGAIGARTITAWEHLEYYSSFGSVPFSYFITHSGKSIIGALAGAYLAIFLSKRALKYTLSTGDCYAAAIPVAMAIGRIGCFFSELPLGTPTSLPWGMTVSPEIAANFSYCPYCDKAMHPSMIYEIIFHLLALFVILRWRKHVYIQGETLKFYLLASAIFRFSVEFVRGNEEQFWGLSGPQIVLIPLTSLLIWHFYRQWKSGIYRMPDPIAPSSYGQG